MASQPWRHCSTTKGTPITPVLQWGHGFSAMETEVGLLVDLAGRGGFNGAMASQPWRRRSVPPASRRPARFNGAMASQPWRHRGTRLLLSLRPCFNGAMASQPWRHVRTSAGPIARRAASMGPWLLSHGDKQTAPKRKVAAKPLQWGHGFSAMETLILHLSPTIPQSTLQWGHGFSAMETRVERHGRLRVRNQLQWGHGFSAISRTPDTRQEEFSASGAVHVRGPTGRQSGTAAVRSGLPAEHKTDNWCAASRRVVASSAAGHHSETAANYRVFAVASVRHRIPRETCRGNF